MWNDPSCCKMQRKGPFFVKKVNFAVLVLTPGGDFGLSWFSVFSASARVAVGVSAVRWGGGGQLEMT